MNSTTPNFFTARACRVSFLAATLLLSSAAFAQNRPPNPPPPPPLGNGGPNAAPRNTVDDPGVRQGIADSGGPLANLDTYESRYFFAALERFREISSVSGKLPDEEGIGLGPRFNGNSCASCHAFPALGGTSPRQNPQIAVATLHGARNTVPPFITTNGPVRVARFVRNPDGTPDGGVHDLFVISGRTDAPGCQITQPDFARALAADNVVFRIPTPMFGLGLVESTPDANLEAAAAANGAQKAALGISGHFNRNNNDGTITRFGWKAQNKSLLIFAGEAYNVEQGVTNEVFPNEREGNAGCQFNAGPEDDVTLTNTVNSASPASDYASDSVNFATLFRLSAPPTAMTPTASTQRGQQVFVNIGCQLCHTPSQTTGRSTSAALTNVTYHPYSDFAVHNMGQRLNDGVTQGDARGGDWRTVPLWGLGQRIFLLHDGRTANLVEAITTHASQGSEANAVITQFNQLSGQDVADLLNFLRSL